MNLDNFSEEFFYDSSFEDYERKYIMCFLMNGVSSNAITIPKEVYIMSERPEGLELKLTDVIGTYYPKKDLKGIYGTYSMFHDAYNALLHFGKLTASGYYTVTNEEVSHYRLNCVYIDLK